MTNDPAKFPRHVSPPKRSALDFDVESAWYQMRMSVTREAALRYARDLVTAKALRGDYPEIAHMDDETRERLAVMAVAEWASSASSVASKGNARE